METHEQHLQRIYRDNRSRLVAFIRGKVNDDALAEDILQDSLLRALRGSAELEDSERMDAWLYQVIRNAVTDAYRRSAARQRKLERFAVLEDGAHVPETDLARLCGCLHELLPTLKPEYAEVLEAMDLGEATTEEMTARLGITANNLKVRRFRARQQLKASLERTCRTCAEHGCLDCTCGS